MFAELKDPVRRKLERYELIGPLDPAHFFPTLDAAIEAFREETRRELDATHRGTFLAQDPRQSEEREGAAVAEPGQRGDLVALEREDEQSEGPRDLGLGATGSSSRRRAGRWRGSARAAAGRRDARRGR